MELKVFYAPYELFPRRALGVLAEPGSRKGSLLKWVFEDGLVGYSDCHPWAPLGDLPLDNQLEALLTGRLTPLLKRSKELARLDAKARARKASLFEGLVIPKSHYLQQPGGPNCCLKLKLNGALPPPLTLLAIPKNQLLRLDFNNTLLVTDEWIKNLERLHIDFLEDPCPVNTPQWQQLASKFPLAVDHAVHEHIYGRASVLVVKPAIQDPSHFLQVIDKRVVFTSYLDHPLGQIAACYEAANFYRQRKDLEDTCGLFSHLVYEENMFSRELRVKDGRLCPPSGTGFGFDHLLREMKWQPL